MRHNLNLLAIALLALGFWGCRPANDSKNDEAGNEVPTDTVNDLRVSESQIDSLELITRPRTVLVTRLPQYRLTPIMKKNWDSDHVTTFYGDIEFRSTWVEDEIGVNVWHSHVVPGYEAACGYNVVNVSHFDSQTRQQHYLFESLVLVKTLYYPSFVADTLARQPVLRDGYLVSVYDEDTNHDGYVNPNDLRRFYHFALPGLEKTTLIPKDHTVVSSEYDPGLDWMYVFTRQDTNKNGKLDAVDPWHVFWVDMKDPRSCGMVM